MRPRRPCSTSSGKFWPGGPPGSMGSSSPCSPGAEGPAGSGVVPAAAARCPGSGTARSRLADQPFELRGRELDGLAVRRMGCRLGPCLAQAGQDVLAREALVAHELLERVEPVQV